jgi:hypothetical protein
MGGLAGYTLLLAVTACLLVRFGNVWDDVRTVLLLVVLMFLATSVTFDAVLVATPGRGAACYLLGLLFAALVSEAILRGTRLGLPPWFRGPYYLILALFFLYPLALTPLLRQPRSEALMWGLFGFSSVAGLVFLTLLPAARRGPVYVVGNGSPWRWPLYPWVLFGVLAAAVPARAFLLCWSLHLLDGADLNRLIFGPYFVIPFGLAVAVLLLEIGLAPRGRDVLPVALLAPVGLVGLALAGHQPDQVYQGFLETFTGRLGGDPVALALVASAGFYAYAALRRVPAATEALTAALAALAVAGPDSLSRGGPTGVGSPLWAAPPILAAAALQLALGVRRRSSWRCLAGGVLVALAALPGDGEAPLRAVVAFHLALLAVLAVGAAFKDALARRLRAAGVVLAMLAGLAALVAPVDLSEGVPPWAPTAYPLALAAVLLAYGLGLRYRPAPVAAGAVLLCWVVVAGWGAYGALRQVVPGLDHIAASLGLFGLAVLVSLGKAGVLPRWLGRWWGEQPILAGTGIAPAAPEGAPDAASLVQVPGNFTGEQPGAG